MLAKELREKSIDELNVELISQLKEQFSLRMQANGEGVKSHLLTKVRKNIARIKTLITEKQGSKND